MDFAPDVVCANQFGAVFAPFVAANTAEIALYDHESFMKWKYDER